MVGDPAIEGIHPEAVVAADGQPSAEGFFFNFVHLLLQFVDLLLECLFIRHGGQRQGQGH